MQPASRGPSRKRERAVFVGRELRALRLKAGVDLTDLAAELGISVAQQYRREVDTPVPQDVAQAWRLALVRLVAVRGRAVAESLEILASGASGA